MSGVGEVASKGEGSTGKNGNKTPAVVVGESCCALALMLTSCQPLSYFSFLFLSMTQQSMWVQAAWTENVNLEVVFMQILYILHTVTCDIVTYFCTIFPNWVNLKRFSHFVLNISMSLHHIKTIMIHHFVMRIFSSNTFSTQTAAVSLKPPPTLTTLQQVVTCKLAYHFVSVLLSLKKYTKSKFSVLLFWGWKIVF